MLSTTHGNPFYNLLEIIWTRLYHQFKIEEKIWKGGYDFEETTPFLKCRPASNKGKNGWEMSYAGFKPGFVDRKLVRKNKGPIRISEFQYQLLCALLNGDLMKHGEFYSELSNVGSGSNQLEEIDFLKRLHIIYENAESYCLRVDELEMRTRDDSYYITKYKYS